MAHCSKAVLYKVLNLAVQMRVLFVKVSTISTEYASFLYLLLPENLISEFIICYNW